MTEFGSSGAAATFPDRELRGVDFLQVARPRDLVLPDEVHLPGGERLGGARARVYALLEETRGRRLSWRIGRHTGPPGAVPTHVLCEPWSGGMEGTKRLREVRAALRRSREEGTYHDLGIRRDPWVDPDGRVTSTWLYRLVGATGAAAGRPPANQPAHPPTHPVEETEVGATPGPPPHAPPSAHPPPLSGLHCWLVKGDPAELAGEVQATASYCVTPGCACWLAPSAELTRQVTEGELGTAEASQAYRQELLAHYKQGHLVRELSGHRRLVLWTTNFALDPLPMLAHALGALGATIIHYEETP